MKKQSVYISLILIIVIIFGVIIYKNIQKNKNKSNISTPIESAVDQNGWTTITDCRNIKLYLGDGKVSVSGLDNEQDIAGNPELKILSIGLPESIYGPRKRLEVSYAKPSDYENCSPDVKKIIENEVIR